MTHAQLIKLILAQGFERTGHALAPNYFTRGETGIIIDYSHGAFRFVLGFRRLPWGDLEPDLLRGEVEGISPEFYFFDREGKSTALDEAWAWLESTGFRFLEDPHVKELHRWVTEDKMHLRGVIIPRPPRWLP